MTEKMISRLIDMGCRRHSIIEELSDGSAYADLGIGSHGKFAGIIKSIVDASGILNN